MPRQSLPISRVYPNLNIDTLNPVSPATETYNHTITREHCSESSHHGPPRHVYALHDRIARPGNLANLLLGRRGKRNRHRHHSQPL